MSAIIRFFQINNDDFNLTIRTFKLHLPSDDSVNDEDKPYTVEDICRVIGKCDPRSKAVILLMCSTGIRIGVIPLMRVEDLTEIMFQGMNLYRVQVYARTRDKYFTFCTSESYNAIRDYFEYRKRHVENLELKAPLIRERFNIDDKLRVQYPKFISKRAVEYLIDRALRTSGVRKIGEIHMSHGFRRFFISQCESSPMKSLHVSMLSGHTTGIKKNYYTPKEPVLLEDYLSHAADALTIDPTIKSCDLDRRTVHGLI